MEKEKKEIRPNENIGLWFHELSKDISMGGKVNIPIDSKNWPEGWKTIDYKIYKYTEKIKLIEIPNLKFSFLKLDELLKKRRSKRNFKYAEHKITKEELSYLCKYGFGEFEEYDTQIEVKKIGNYSHKKFRTHPSGGGRYSLEYYIFINHSDDFRKGIYHYNIFDHSMELLECFEGKESPKIFGYEWAYDASCFIFITSVFKRNMRKYGERGYRYILLEAGHVGQNLYLLATNLNLNVTAIGGTKDEKIEELIGTDGKTESLVYTILIG